MSKEGWVKRITINGDQVIEDDQTVTPERATEVKKLWKQQQAIDLSIWGDIPDTDVLKFLEKGKL